MAGRTPAKQPFAGREWLRAPFRRAFARLPVRDKHSTLHLCHWRLQWAGVGSGQGVVRRQWPEPLASAATPPWAHTSPPEGRHQAVPPRCCAAGEGNKPALRDAPCGETAWSRCSRQWHRCRVLGGCVSFAGFFAHFKEKIVGNDFSRQPRRGEAQGCAEQIGSGASLRLSEAAPPQIAHETDHPNPKSNILPSNIVDC